MAADGFDRGFLRNIWKKMDDASRCCAKLCRQSAYFGHVAIARTRAYGGFNANVGLGPIMVDPANPRCKNPFSSFVSFGCREFWEPKVLH